MSQQTMTMPPLPAGPSAHNWRRLFTLENRFVPPIFITLILLAGNFSFGILESYTRTLLAIGSAIAAELILGRITTGKWPHLASARETPPYLESIEFRNLRDAVSRSRVCGFTEHSMG
jgi:hypothetical protein